MSMMMKMNTKGSVTGMTVQVQYIALCEIFRYVCLSEAKVE